MAASTPGHFLIGSEDDPVRCYYLREAVERPAGKSTQWLVARFRTLGMFRHSPGSHFAVALRAELGFDEEGVARTISGRGITLGDTSLASPDPQVPEQASPRFGGARGAQVESFWHGGNFLYRETGVLPDGLRDGTWYHVHVHVHDECWIAFWIDDGDGARIAGPAIVQDDALHPVTPGRTGVVIALGRGADETGPWRAEFRDIGSGWF
ncbi:MAG TPA: hypothetical protein VFG21_02365 [Xanthomonadaceae bacterium]|nr:hypothetical protein [Xanthomonadaceae bacterium]